MAAPELDEGIAVTARADDPTTYDADLGEGWQIGSGVNGGLLLAVLGNALRATLGAHGHGDPVSVSGYYLSARARGRRWSAPRCCAPGAACPPGRRR